MKRLFVRLLTLVSLLTLAIAISPVAAHEGREIGDYEISFGWRNEPAIQGLFNGPDLYISLHDTPTDADTQATLEALVVEMQVEVMFGSESRIMSLTPDFPMYEEYDGVGSVNYVADLIPTLPGDYSFRVYGTIGEVEVDELFTSTDGEFSSIEPATDIMFPEAGITDVAALLERIDALEARLAELEAATE
ncbi:MAG: hypothetical protein H7Y11_11445 [Armatimonadetes bacterium]|nr:hypothetical protein [Anaerolineae bacterium]